MPSESLPDITPPLEAVSAAEPDTGSADAVELSEFSQRLASFGLGEAPDPLLTEARPPVKRRSRP